MNKEWNEAIEAAAKALDVAKEGFTCPEYSVSGTDCLIARAHYGLAADEVRKLRREG